VSASNDVFFCVDGSVVFFLRDHNVVVQFWLPEAEKLLPF